MAALDQSQAVPPTTWSAPAASAAAISRASPSDWAAAHVGSSFVAGFCPRTMGAPLAAVAPVSRTAWATASSMLPMTLWLVAATPTVLPAATRARIIRAPV